MRIHVLARHIEASDQFSRYVEEKLKALLARHKRRLTQVTVRLDDVNGPRGGRDKTCQVLIEGAHGALIVRDVAEDEYLAFSRAADRAIRTLIRTQERRRRPILRPRQVTWGTV